MAPEYLILYVGVVLVVSISVFQTDGEGSSPSTDSI